MGYKHIFSLAVVILLSYCDGSMGESIGETETNSTGIYIQVLTGKDGIRGRDGIQGRDGPKGRDGIPGGPRGESGPQGNQGTSGSQSGGATYTRWGKSICPGITGTQLVYAGIAGGSQHNQNGGGGNYLCLPEVPEYSTNLTYRRDVQDQAPIHGAEYENPILGKHNYNVRCAVCRVSSRPTIIMIPAMASCPSTWTREYYGYLMTQHQGQRRTEFECVDKAMDSFPDSQADTNGALFYHTEANCGTGLPCPDLYNNHQELNCVVCTK